MTSLRSRVVFGVVQSSGELDCVGALLRLYSRHEGAIPDKTQQVVPMQLVPAELWEIAKRRLRVMNHSSECLAQPFEDKCVCEELNQVYALSDDEERRELLERLIESRHEAVGHWQCLSCWNWYDDSVDRQFVDQVDGDVCPACVPARPQSDGAAAEDRP